MGIEKKIAYYNPKMDPSPIMKDIDGMWISRSEPYIVLKVWKNDSERPKLEEEPPYIQAYAAFMANHLYTFEPIKNKSKKR